MTDGHIPHPNAPKCWVCKGLLGSCPCETNNKPKVEEPLTFKGQFEEAYRAFVGAFDTPQMRRFINDEYAVDARQRMRRIALRVDTMPEATTAEALALKFVEAFHAWHTLAPTALTSEIQDAHTKANQAYAEAAKALGLVLPPNFIDKQEARSVQ